MVHCKYENRAEIQVAVYDRGSLNTSRQHYIDKLADKLSQKNLSQNFLSSIFKQYWEITEHTDVAAITSK